MARHQPAAEQPGPVRVEHSDRVSEPEFEQVLESAARLQRLVPDAVLVGGTAAALHAGHRLSYDHDHDHADLQDRFEAVLDDIEDDESWRLNRMTPGKIILGELGGIETGVRQMRRSRPLEVVQVELPSGSILTVPTIEEALRIKAFLVVQRNQVRDYLDTAALSDRMGLDHAAGVLVSIDKYYADQRAGDEAVASQLARQLADPRPKDSRTLTQLQRYKGLAERWTTWDEVRSVLSQLAAAMLSEAEAEAGR
ncbi:MAG TPA: hypothetical protein VJ851_10165 [Jatrophihabitans sp.]|nr:hypothetical protein [Jatrophihabitans sp.]